MPVIEYYLGGLIEKRVETVTERRQRADQARFARELEMDKFVYENLHIGHRSFRMGRLIKKHEQLWNSPPSVNYYFKGWRIPFIGTNI